MVILLVRKAVLVDSKVADGFILNVAEARLSESVWEGNDESLSDGEKETLSDCEKLLLCVIECDWESVSVSVGVPDMDGVGFVLLIRETVYVKDGERVLYVPLSSCDTETVKVRDVDGSGLSDTVPDGEIDVDGDWDSVGSPDTDIDAVVSNDRLAVDDPDWENVNSSLSVLDELIVDENLERDSEGLRELVYSSVNDFMDTETDEDLEKVDEKDGEPFVGVGIMETVWLTEWICMDGDGEFDAVTSFESLLRVDEGELVSRDCVISFV
jgi:hypothetical protein